MVDNAVFAKIKAICLAHPDTCVTLTWGSPHFRIGGAKGKIFAGWGQAKDGSWSLGVKVDPTLQSALVASDTRFKVAAYVGRYGWVDFTPSGKPNWGEVEALVATSYQLIGGDAEGAADAKAKPKPKARPVARKRAAKKPAARKTTRRRRK